MTDKELNEAVARKLGWIIDTTSDFFSWYGRPNSRPESVMLRNLPDYCHSIAAAWEIVEKIIGDGFTISIDGTWRFGKKAYQCRTSARKEAFSGVQDTAPMAICLAFLKLDKKAKD